MNYNNDTGLIDTILVLDTTETPPVSQVGYQTNVLAVLGTGALTLPGGTTAQQPGTTTGTAYAGMLRYNNGGYLEFYDGVTSSWQTLSYAAGTVTSVALNTVTGSDAAIITTTPTVGATGAVAETITFNTQAANLVFAGPASGAAAQPTFRSLVSADIAGLTVTYATNLSGGTTGSVTYQSAPNTTTFLSPGTTGQVLTSNGPSSAPSYTSVVNSFSAGSTGFTPTTASTGAVTLAGTLGLANGGTNFANTGSNGSIMYNNGTAIVNSTVGANNQALLSTGAGAPTWLTVSSTVTTNQILQGDGLGAFTANGGTFVGSGTYSGVTLNGTVTNPTDATTKFYVDSIASGLTWKNAVAAIAQSDINIAGATPLVIDGYTVQNGDRILLNGQTAPADPNGAVDNGIYVIAITGGTYTLTRSTDMPIGANADGDAMFVENGTTYANTAWVETNTPAIVGTNTLHFVQFSGSGSYTAGAGLLLTGTVFSARTDGVTTHIDGSNNIAVLSSTTLDQVLLSQGTGNTAAWGAITLSNTNSVTGTLAVANGGTGAVSFTANQVLYGNGTSPIQATAAGADGQVLTVVGGVPTWSTPSAEPALTATYIGYGDATNLLTGTPDFTWTESTATLAISGAANAATIQPIINEPIFGDPSFVISNTQGITISSNLGEIALSAGNVYFGTSGTAYGTVSYNGGGLSLNSEAGLYLTPAAGQSLYINGQAGTTGQVLTSQGTTSSPIWTDISTEAVTTFQTSLSGLTPNTPTAGAVTLAGTLGVASGGTGDNTLTSNGILFGNGTSPIGVTAAGAQYNVLTVNNSGVPVLSTIDLSQPNAVGSSILQPANGGTGVANSNTSTITLGGSFTTTPNNNVVLTTTGPTNVTLPTSGTLLTAADALTSFSLNDTSTTPIFTTSPTTASVGAVASTIILNTQGANVVFAGPTTGSAEPTFRALVYGDVVGSGKALQLYAENPSSPSVPLATAANAIALGSGSLSSQYGGVVQASGVFEGNGDAQHGTYVLRGQTSGTTPTELFLDGASLEYIIPAASVVTFSILISARRTDATGFGGGFRVEGVAYSDGPASTATLIGATSTTILGRNPNTLTVAVTANTATGGLKIMVTGVSASSYNWVAVLQTAEVTN